jgi:hypothetical protein
VLGVEAEVDEGVVAEGGGHEDVAAVASVAAGGTAFGNELFAPEGHAAVAPVAGLDPDSRFINKHAISSVQACPGGARLLILLTLGGRKLQEMFLIVADFVFAYTYELHRNHLLIDLCECWCNRPMTE